MHFCSVWKGQFIANMLTCCQQGARNLSQHEITVTLPNMLNSGT